MTDWPRPRAIDGQGFSNNMTFERCNLLVVEAINKDPNYIYGKRIWYLDPETYYIMHTEIYDQQGRFWKLFFNSTQPLKSSTGVMKPVIVGTHFYDAQRVPTPDWLMHKLSTSPRCVIPQSRPTGLPLRTCKKRTKPKRITERKPLRQQSCRGFLYPTGRGCCLKII